MRSAVDSALGNSVISGRFAVVEHRQERLPRTDRLVVCFAITRAICARCPRSCATQVANNCSAVTVPNVGCSPVSWKSVGDSFQAAQIDRFSHAGPGTPQAARPARVPCCARGGGSDRTARTGGSDHPAG